MPDIVDVLRKEGASFIESQAATYALRRVPGGAVEVLVVVGTGATPIGRAPVGRRPDEDGGVHRIIAEHALGLARPSPRPSDVRPSVAATMGPLFFHPYDSGGGTMVWRKEVGDGSVLYVSNEAADGPLDGDPAAPTWLAGRYGELGGAMDVTAGMPLAEALAVAEALPDPVGFDGTPTDVACGFPAGLAAAAEARDAPFRALAASTGYRSVVRAVAPAEGVQVFLIEPGGGTTDCDEGDDLWNVVTREADGDRRGEFEITGSDTFHTVGEAAEWFAETVAQYAAPSLGLR